MSDYDNAAAAEPTAVTLLGTKPQSASVRCRESRRRGPAASLALLPSPLLGAPGLRPSLRRGSPSAGRGQLGAVAGGAAVAQDSAAHGSDSFALTRSCRRAWCEGPAAASQPGAGAGSPVARRGLLRGGQGVSGGLRAKPSALLYAQGAPWPQGCCPAWEVSTPASPWWQRVSPGTTPLHRAGRRNVFSETLQLPRPTAPRSTHLWGAQ